jgi:hypothetical protein
MATAAKRYHELGGILQSNGRVKRWPLIPPLHLKYFIFLLKKARWISVDLLPRTYQRQTKQMSCCRVMRMYLSTVRWRARSLAKG